MQQNVCVRLILRVVNTLLRQILVPVFVSGTLVLSILKALSL